MPSQNTGTDTRIDVDSVTAFYLMLGGGTLLYTNSPEARLISGVDPTETGRIEAHASALVAMLIPRRINR